jgi:hypothetical protein
LVCGVYEKGIAIIFFMLNQGFKKGHSNVASQLRKGKVFAISVGICVIILIYSLI